MEDSPETVAKMIFPTLVELPILKKNEEAEETDIAEEPDDSIEVRNILCDLPSRNLTCPCSATHARLVSAVLRDRPR
jgi:hypothetical protein